MTSVAEVIEEGLDAIEVDERMKALAGVYQTADTVIAGERVKVSVGRFNNTEIPAWTTGVEIMINAEQVNTRDFEDLVRLHGLNFHELAHVLYSPRAGTTLMQWASENYYMPAFNILEDQRIESLLTMRYPSTVPWLTATVMRWVVNRPEAMDTGYLMVRGRRYLPGRLRGILRSQFAEPGLLHRIDKVVDAYRVLAFPSDYEQAKPLIREMHDILFELNRKTPKDPNGHSEAPYHVCDKGRPVSVKEQRQLRDQMGSEQQPGSPQDSTPQEGGDSDSSPSSSPSEEPKESTASQDSNDSSSGGAAGSSEHDEDSRDLFSAKRDAQRESARRDIEEMFDDLLDRSDVQSDIRRTQKAIAEATGSEVIRRAPAVDHVDAIPEFAVMAHQLTNTLLRLREEAEPGWHRRVDSGRLNVVRWVVDRDPEEAFDRWDEGVADAVNIEAVILLDASGSMNGVINEAYNAMWVLKRAFDTVEISSTVIVYDEINDILYGSDESATAAVRVALNKGGGTDPTRGLQQAARILGNSSKSQKLLIVLTDGEWFSSVDDYGMSADNYIARMNDVGVTTALGFMVEANPEIYKIGEGWVPATPEDVAQKIRENAHGCRLVAPADGHNLVPFISGIVTDMIRTKIRTSR